MTDFTLILRSLNARLFSTVITALTVAVAVALILTLLSMRDAGRRAFTRGIGTADLVVVAGGSSPLVAILNTLFYANPPPASLGWADYRRIAEGYPLEFAVPTQQGDSYRGFPVLATKPEFFTAFQPAVDAQWAFASGRGFEREFEVVAGAAVARATGLGIGDTVYLTHGIAQSRQLGAPAAAAPHVHTDFAYRVVGVLAPTGSAHDRALFTDLTSSWTIHAHDRRRAADPTISTTTPADLIEADRRITAIYLGVATRPGQQVSAVKPAVFDALRREPSLTVADPVQQVSMLFTIVSNIDDVFLAMAWAVLASSGIAIMLALYNSMEQRRRQVAVFRVLGCSRPRVLGLIVTESAMIGLAGALAGVLLMQIAGRVAAGVMKQRLGLVIEPVIEPGWLLGVVVGTVLLAAAAGLLPGVLAYRTDVARHLRPSD